MVTYAVEIVGISHVATCRNLREVRDALEDAQCVLKMNVTQALTMADCLRETGTFFGTVAVDNRFNYSVKEVE